MLPASMNTAARLKLATLCRNFKDFLNYDNNNNATASALVR